MSDSQRMQILRHMWSGNSITTMEAFEKFRCTRLAARVVEIRESGHNVTAEMVKIGGARVARYRIAR